MLSMALINTGYCRVVCKTISVFCTTHCSNMELLPNTMGVLLSKLRIKFQFQYIVQFTSPAMLDAVSNSVYYNTILKPKQVLCLEYLYNYISNMTCFVFYLLAMESL